MAQEPPVSFRVTPRNKAILRSARLVGINASQFINRAITAHEDSLVEDIKRQRDQADKLQNMLNALSQNKK